MVALPVLAGQWHRRTTPPNRFVRAVGSWYLFVLAALWVGASRDYFAARHGIGEFPRDFSQCRYARGFPGSLGEFAAYAAHAIIEFVSDTGHKF